jgi:hypothetical protein
MRKISFSFLTVATLVILMTGIGGWVGSTTQARVEAPASVESIDPLRMMMNAPHDLPAGELTDYTVIFEHPSSR